MRYPAFVWRPWGGSIINLFVIPAFAKLFAGLKTELPPITQLMIEFSDFMVQPGRHCSRRHRQRDWRAFIRAPGGVTMGLVAPAARRHDRREGHAGQFARSFAIS